MYQFFTRADHQMPLSRAPATPVCRDAGAVAASGELELALVGDRAGFDALEADWNELFDRAGRSSQVFQTFNWNWHWANVYLEAPGGARSGIGLSIVTGRRNGRLIMVWPLVTERVRGITQIFWMGEPVSQYGDVLLDDVSDALEILEAGWKFLIGKTKADVVRLRRVRADSLVVPILERSGALSANKQIAPYLDLSTAPDFATYETRYAPRARRNRRRLARRLGDQGPMSFERHKYGARAAALAVTALELKADWLKHRGLVSQAISDPRTARFFASALLGETRTVDGTLSGLFSNGEPAALEIAFNCKGRAALHVIVFNMKFEKYGAGVLLLEQCIRDGFEDGIGTYDLLAPGDQYKTDWADGSVEVRDWSQPLTLAGQTYARLYLGLMRPRMKAVAEALPQAWHRLMRRRRMPATEPA